MSRIAPQDVVAAFAGLRLMPLHFTIDPWFSRNGEACHAICALYLTECGHPQYTADPPRFLPNAGGYVRTLAHDWFATRHGQDYFDGFLNGWINPLKPLSDAPPSAERREGYADALRAAAAVQSWLGAEPLAKRILDNDALVSCLPVAA